MSLGPPFCLEEGKLSMVLQGGANLVPPDVCPGMVKSRKMDALYLLSSLVRAPVILGFTLLF